MKYELTLLLPEKEEVKSVKDILLSEKAKIEKEEEWGQKTLAYPIKKHERAFYFLWSIDMDDKRISEVKKKLTFNEKLLRYLLLKKD